MDPVVANRSGNRVPLATTLANVDLHEPRDVDRTVGTRFTLSLAGNVTLEETLAADTKAPAPPRSMNARLRSIEDPCFGDFVQFAYDYEADDDTMGVALYDERDMPVFATLGHALMRFEVSAESPQCFTARAFDVAGNFSPANDLFCAQDTGCSCSASDASHGSGAFLGTLLLAFAVARRRS